MHWFEPKMGFVLQEGLLLAPTTVLLLLLCDVTF
jgi:hypothetical protein